MRLMSLKVITERGEESQIPGRIGVYTAEEISLVVPEG